MIIRDQNLWGMFAEYCWICSRENWSSWKGEIGFNLFLAGGFSWCTLSCGPHFLDVSVFQHHTRFFFLRLNSNHWLWQQRKWSMYHFKERHDDNLFCLTSFWSDSTDMMICVSRWEAAPYYWSHVGFLHPCTGAVLLPGSAETLCQAAAQHGSLVKPFPMCECVRVQTQYHCLSCLRASIKEHKREMDS